MTDERQGLRALDIKTVCYAILGGTSYKPHREAAERILAALAAEYAATPTNPLVQHNFGFPWLGKTGTHAVNNPGWEHPDSPWSGLGLCLASDERPGYGCVLPDRHDGDHDKWHRSAFRHALATPSAQDEETP